MICLPQEISLEKEVFPNPLQRFPHLCLPSARIVSVCHHTWFPLETFSIYSFVYLNSASWSHEDQSLACYILLIHKLYARILRVQCKHFTYSLGTVYHFYYLGELFYVLILRDIYQSRY